MKTMNKKMPILYNIGKILIGWIYNLYYNPKVINKHYIPKDGPIIIVGNHKHVYDQFSAILSTKRGIHYMAKKEYFEKPFSKFIFENVGCISVDRTKKDEEAVKKALNILHDGGAVGLFPEGTRNKTNEFLLPFKFGAVSMAKKTGAYLVPFGLTGDYTFRSKNLTMRFGKPFKVAEDMDLETANNKLYKTIKKLMKENLKEEKKYEKNNK